MSSAISVTKPRRRAASAAALSALWLSSTTKCRRSGAESTRSETAGSVSIARRIVSGNRERRLYFVITSRASGASLGGVSVGPEATFASSPRGTSETIKVICSQCGAHSARRPPFTAEKARRTALISPIEAPQLMSVRFADCKSVSVISSLIGHSIIAEPPPEIRKIRSARSLSARLSKSRQARAAKTLCSFGSGCPP